MSTPEGVSQPSASEGFGDVAAQSPVTPGPAQGVPPVLPPIHGGSSGLVKRAVSLLLSLFLLLLLADGVLTLLSLAGSEILAGIANVSGFGVTVVAALVYLLIGLTPAIPKRVFLPLTLFVPLAIVAATWAMFFATDHFNTVMGILSVIEIALGGAALLRSQRALRCRWPLVPEASLNERVFSWSNTVIFYGINILILPVVLVFGGAVGTSMAINHASDGFIDLSHRGFAVRVRHYSREDGKNVHLVPMAHIGDATFYHKVSQSFPTNSIILMEGVTDMNKLITNTPSYKRTAAKLGLSDQDEEFTPTEVRIMSADVDTSDFSSNTVAMLNLAMLVHTKGLTPEVLGTMVEPLPPDVLFEFFDELIGLRNRHLVGEVKKCLPQEQDIVVPWGAAHMPGIARELKKAGFRLENEEEYIVIRFGGPKRSNRRSR